PLRVGTGRHLAQALTDHGLGEDGSGGRAVTGDVVGLVGYLVGELGTHVLPRVVQLDLLGDGDAVVRDGGGSPLLLQNDVATLGAEDRKSTRLNSSHVKISYAVFCLKKK